MMPGMTLTVMELDRKIKLEQVMSCLLQSYLISMVGKDALAHEAERLVPNWEVLAEEWEPNDDEERKARDELV